MFDTTGQFTDLNGNKDLSRVSKRPLIVNDINFVPFGDPDAPPNVRRERLHTMLAGDQGSFERKRDMAGQQQQFQPQLLDPKDPLETDQLGDVVDVSMVRPYALTVSSQSLGETLGNQQSQKNPGFETIEEEQVGGTWGGYFRSKLLNRTTDIPALIVHGVKAANFISPVAGAAARFGGA